MANQYPNTQHRSRLLAKCVDVKRIRDWIPEKDRRQVDITTAWTVIKNHYCAALVGRGVCPVDCTLCRETITSMFGLDAAANPEALLTWRAKDRGAAMIENLIAAQKCEHPFPALETEHDPLAALFPKKQTGNLFEALQKDYL